MNSLVRAQIATLIVKDATGADPASGALCHECVVPPRGNETEFLAFTLASTKQPKLGRFGADLGFRRFPQREPQPRQRGTQIRVKEVTLILVHVTPSEQLQACSGRTDPCVMTGSHLLRAEPLGER